MAGFEMARCSVVPNERR